MLVSIIIPSKSGNPDVERLMQSIRAQNLPFNHEIIKITGVTPSGRARNHGAQQSSGTILVFLDDDIDFGHNDVIKNIVAPLNDESIVLSGVSQKIPEDSNSFQKRCAEQIQHTEHPVVKKLTEVGMVGGACCATRKEMFDSLGGFNEKLQRGVDVEFSHRVKKNNCRVVLVPKTWIYHPAPDNFRHFIRLHFRNGRATAYADRNYPELNYDVGTDHLIYSLEKRNFSFRIIRFFKNILIAILHLHFLSLTARIVYLLGYSRENIFPKKQTHVQ